MKTFEYLLLVGCVLAIIGCASGSLSGTGINAQNPVYGGVTANSFNASGNIGD